MDTATLETAKTIQSNGTYLNNIFQPNGQPCACKFNLNRTSTDFDMNEECERIFDDSRTVSTEEGSTESEGGTKLTWNFAVGFDDLIQEVCIFTVKHIRDKDHLEIRDGMVSFSRIFHGLDLRFKYR